MPWLERACDTQAAADHEAVATRFFREHCVGWWPSFTVAIGQHAETAFFRVAASVLGAFTEVLVRDLGVEERE